MQRHGLIKYLQVIVPAAALLIAAGCSTLRVTTDYNRTVNFAAYHTYSWLKVRAGNSLWEDRIRRDVDEQLTARGWMVVPSGGQAAVAASGSTREVPMLETFYSGSGPGFDGWWWDGWAAGGGIATTEVVNITVGTLVVDIFDNNTEHLIWRGTASQVLSGNPRKNERKLAREIADMFKKFPPESRG